MSTTQKTLMLETEMLIKSMVREARLGRVLEKDAPAVKPDIADRVKIVDAANKFMQIKAKLDPETQETEFERELRELRGGGAEPDPEGDS